MARTSQELHRAVLVMLVAVVLAAGLDILSNDPRSPLQISTPLSGFMNLSDDQGYTKGSLTAFMAPFNRGQLVGGQDYVERFSLDKKTFPGSSQISWNWPTAKARDPIRGFLAIDYGNYYNTVPERPIQAAQVRDIKQASCDYDLSLSGNLAGFDAIIDFYLTASPGFSKILFEVEVFLHTPEYAKFYSDSVAPIGIFVSNTGTTWKVSIDPHAALGPDILIYPQTGTDALIGRVDVKEILAWLASRKIITGDEFFNGLAIGIEPQQKDGVLTVNKLSVSYNLANDR